MSYIERFLTFLETLPEGLIYFILGLSAFVENVFPPIPGDTITAFGAFLVGTQRLQFAGVYLATTFGSLLGFVLLFRVGGLLGRRFFMDRDYRFFKAKDIRRAEDWFQRYGYLLILINRFLPGVRSVISIAAGFSKLKTLNVVLLSLISASAWNLIWIGLGHFLGSHWETVRDRMAGLMARYTVGVLILLALCILFFLACRYLKRPR